MRNIRDGLQDRANQAGGSPGRSFSSYFSLNSAASQHSQQIRVAAQVR
jgi:hypothetical protein